MEPWHKVVTPRKEDREGRSFNPDEFAIALEQVVAGTAPADYVVMGSGFRKEGVKSAVSFLVHNQEKHKRGGRNVRPEFGLIPAR